ncbi:hypothetical protein DPMN_166971 [Dreissena polymorpha]|uniref:Uncharacterized protein n=1 Tax=Dreissena polymorpha TaxID=45954 RepID=A0A9D4IXV6_DREPO|nr:hypothetical protein DPMN_166971 [Dreissena polymorpha]
MTSTLVGPQETVATKAGLVWTRHQQESMCKTFLQSTLEGSRLRGRQNKSWMDKFQRVDIPFYG